MDYCAPHAAPRTRFSQRIGSSLTPWRIEICVFARLVRKLSCLIAICLMPIAFWPSAIFLTDFGCNEIAFFSGVSWVTFFAPAKKVTRSPQASESFAFLRREDQKQGA